MKVAVTISPRGYDVVLFDRAHEIKTGRSI